MDPMTDREGPLRAFRAADEFALEVFRAIRGFATGVTAHGIGTARAFQESEEAGAFSGLAMGLCGLVTAVLFPIGVWLVRALAS